MTPILTFLAVYAAIYVTLNLVAIPYRKRLVDSVTEAKAKVRSPHLRSVLDTFTLSMTSMRTSVILLLIFTQMLIEPKGKLLRSSELSEEENALYEDGLMREILETHMASAAAANPLFGALAYVARTASHIRARSILGEDDGVREAHLVSSRYAAC